MEGIIGFIAAGIVISLAVSKTQGDLIENLVGILGLILFPLYVMALIFVGMVTLPFFVICGRGKEFEAFIKKVGRPFS